MNPLTNVRNIQKLNENDLKNGIFDHNLTWHKQYKDSAYIFIGGLPYDLTEGDILCVFSQYGEIVNINLVRDKKTGKSKGYGFLCYEDQRSSILAVDNFNNIKLGGRTIRVDHVAEYRAPKSDEKDEDGKYKVKIEAGCAPKTPSPVPSDDEILPRKKQKKKQKEKKKKKKYSKENDLLDSDEDIYKKDHRSKYNDNIERSRYHKDYNKASHASISKSESDSDGKTHRKHRDSDIDERKYRDRDIDKRKHKDRDFDHRKCKDRDTDERKGRERDSDYRRDRDKDIDKRKYKDRDFDDRKRRKSFSSDSEDDSYRNYSSKSSKKSKR